MTINRIDTEGHGELLITEISKKILDALPAAGWNVAVMDDNAYQKKYLCSRDEGIQVTFTRMELVMTSALKQGTDAVLHLNFNFFSTTDINFKHVPHTFLDAYEEIMLRSWIPIGKSATVDRANIPKNSLIDFGNGDVVRPSCLVQIRYQVPKWTMDIYDNVVPYRLKSRDDKSSQPMYEGLPELFDFAIDLVVCKPVHDSWSIVAYHQLTDILKAAHQALVHYFTLTLNEEFLQNSHIGTPYQKWAKIANENFQAVDKGLKALLPTIDHIYGEISNVDDSYGGGSTRSEWVWVEKLNKKYTCCHIKRVEPSLTLSAINFDGWLDLSRKRFGNVYNFKTAPVVIKTQLHIVDRSVLMELKNSGRARVDKMSASLACLATWLEANYTIAEVTTLRTKPVWK